MSDKPVLLFLHGVGEGDPSGRWKTALDGALLDAGYPGLDAVSVIAPRYPNSLHGVDDSHAVPPLAVRALAGQAAKDFRRVFERREAAVEVLLGRHTRGTGWVAGNAVADLALKVPLFVQAKNYLSDQGIRAAVLRRVLDQVPQSGRLVLVGHSLGSVVAADIIRRLPAGVEVVGMVTIGSPLANPSFHTDGLAVALKEPPANLAWWVNFWNWGDPVTTHRGVSALFPWMVDRRIQSSIGPHAHDAETYLADEAVATAIGHALFGSRSKDLVALDRGVDMPLDYAETVALAALRYAFLTGSKMSGDPKDRYQSALRQVQANTCQLIAERNARESRLLASAIAALAVDLADPDSAAPEPTRIHHLAKDEAVVPVISMLASNVIRPFEIDVPPNLQREALQDLTIEMGLGRQLADDALSAVAEARRVLASGGANWVKWVALGVGAAAVLATGGMALAAAPAGLAGAAAITSALAAFGPGGMVGGLLTAGALVSVGSGGVAVGLASPATSAEAVEAVVASQLAAEILRKLQGIEPDPSIWHSLIETGIELQRERARIEAISDEAAPTLKEIRRKLDALDRAITYLEVAGLGPATGDTDEADQQAAKARAVTLFGKAADAFRAVDLDGDGIPDKPRARSAVESLFRRKDDGGSSPRHASDDGD